MLHILYTEEEGGDFQEFHYIAKHSDEETQKMYDDAVKSGRLLFSIGDRTINIAPAYICLVKDVDGYDFVLKKRRIGFEIVEDEPETPEYKDPMKEVGEELASKIEKPKEGEANDQ